MNDTEPRLRCFLRQKTSDSEYVQHRSLAGLFLLVASVGSFGRLRLPQDDIQVASAAVVGNAERHTVETQDIHRTANDTRQTALMVVWRLLLQREQLRLVRLHGVEEGVQVACPRGRDFP